jgi:glyoxylase-like metal-dependent hydrolase (beta-lactamase superfamily II)
VHTADESLARGAKPNRNERGLSSYLLRPEAYRTAISLYRRRAGKIVPIAEVSTFEDESILELPGRPRVVHLPGHTPGSAALVFEERGVTMTGDSLVTRNPLTGRTGPQIAPAGLNQDSAQALRSLERLATRSVGGLLPGHGEPWTEGVAEAVRLAKVAGPS